MTSVILIFPLHPGSGLIWEVREAGPEVEARERMNIIRAYLVFIWVYSAKVMESTQGSNWR